MTRTLSALLLFVALPSLAAAHVGVRPRESKPGAEERYSVRVPTEGSVATTSVRLEIPDGVTVLEVEKMGGETFEVEKKGDRIVAITWKRNIPPKESADFFFRARNPQSGTEIAWKAHLEFAHTGTKVTVFPGGESAYAISRYTIKAKMGERMLDNEGLETLLLIKTPEGWKIRHSHTSGRARRPAQ